jgi:flagellar basal-body rod protein FlgC
MSSISAIALSGLNAAASRLQVSASNVANSQTTGALPNADGTVPAGAPQAYSPLALVQTASAGGGVQTSLTTVSPPTTTVYDPQASFANQDGLIAAPNVDLAQEFVGQLLASYSFAANAAVLRADDQNNKALLDISV